MDAEEKQQLSQAQSLIKEKRYDEALLILQSMPFSDKAGQWLEKLNDVMAKEQLKAAGASPLPQQSTPTEELKPWNPTGFMGTQMILFFGLASALPMTIFFALNWKRLGKPEYVLETILVTVLLVIGLVASVALMIAGVVSPEVGVVALLIFGFSVVALALTLSGLQTSAYKAWQVGGTQALHEHQYDFRKKFFQSGAIILLIVCAVGVGLYYATTPKSFDNAQVRVEYPRSWKVYDTNWAQYCQDDPNYGCYLTLAIESYTEQGGTGIVFASWPSDNPLGEMNGMPQYFKSDPEITYTGAQETSISGRPGLIVDFSATTDDPSWPMHYQTIIFVASDTHVYEINAVTGNQDAHTDHREDIVDMAANFTIK